jgi:hypothetical protein
MFPRWRTGEEKNMRLAVRLSVVFVALLPGCGYFTPAPAPVAPGPPIDAPAIAPLPGERIPKDDEAEALPVAVAALQKLGGKVWEVDRSKPEHPITAISLENAGQRADEAMALLRSFPALRKLDLSHSKVSDAGLARLKDKPDLEVLLLVDTRITDEGVSHVGTLKKLTELDLSSTSITDQGVEHLKGLTRLESLGLRETRITGTGFAHLIGLKKLRELSLGGASISDDGLGHLGALTQLSSNMRTIVDVRGTNASKAAVEGLRKALPGASVVHD